jgi:serine-type D-Ala-D-Ala carboxypeptidase (penicillin-binding protein 5/6)
MDIGADGMKTGFTTESGYGIVGSVERGDRRLFVAMSGMTSEAQRAEEARRILDWGMRAFEKSDIFPEGSVIGEARLYGGAQRSVPLRASGPSRSSCPP